MKNPWIIISVLCALALFGSLHYTYFWCNATDSALLKESAESYAAGEKSTTIASRTENFNKALVGFQKLEEEFKPVNGTGKLYFNLGNTFYQLEQYPWAILNYYRALKLMPREDKVRQNLSIALSKVQQPMPSPPSIWQKLFLTNVFLSVPETLQLLALFTLICLIIASLMIWTPSRWLTPLLLLALCPLLYFASSLVYQRYFAPLEAVIVKATPIYRDAGTQYARVQEEPLAGGQKVEILQLLPKDQWVKVSLPQGTIGYIPLENLRVI